jgi:DNA invertase Pin-like site-specific DNA recombinase
MKAYFAYIRVSTVKQGEQGSSLQEQRSAIEAYAARHSLQIARWFEETETAAKQGRRAFGHMISDLHKEQAAGVIIHKIDRSARNLRDWAQIADLMDRGIEVHCAHDSLDLNTRGGRLSADIQAVIAADYIRNLREEVRKGFYGRLKQGLYPLPAPVGYLNRGKGKPKEIDPLRGPLVRETFELYSTGRYSLDELRKEMARRGFLASGRPLTVNSIVQLLHNPFYIAIINVKRTGETFAGIHTPLVSKALFDRVQAIMAGRLYARPGKHDFTFSRRIRCKDCDRSLVGERQKGHIYYRCHTKACRGTSLSEAQMSKAIGAVLDLLIFDDEELRDVRDLGDEAKTLEERERETWLEQRRMLLARCEERRRRLTDAYLDGTLDKEAFNLRNSELLSERRGLLDALESPPEESGMVRLLKKLERGHVASSQFKTTIPAEKRETLDLIMSNLWAKGKEPVFKLKFPFDELAKERIRGNCGPHKGEHRTIRTFLSGISGHHRKLFE